MSATTISEANSRRRSTHGHVVGVLAVPRQRVLVLEVDRQRELMLAPWRSSGGRASSRESPRSIVEAPAGMRAAAQPLGALVVAEREQDDVTDHAGASRSRDRVPEARTLITGRYCMKAAVFVGEGTVQIEDRPRPVVEKTDDVIMKVSANGLCGSDLRAFETPPQMIYETGVIVGHEFTGIGERGRPGRSAFTEGDRVWWRRRSTARSAGTASPATSTCARTSPTSAPW